MQDLVPFFLWIYVMFMLLLVHYFISKIKSYSTYIEFQNVQTVMNLSLQV